MELEQQMVNRLHAIIRNGTLRFATRSIRIREREDSREENIRRTPIIVISISIAQYVRAKYLTKDFIKPTCHVFV